jgi:hypothetical protein
MNEATQLDVGRFLANTLSAAFHLATPDIDRARESP